MSFRATSRIIPPETGLNAVSLWGPGVVFHVCAMSQEPEPSHYTSNRKGSAPR